MNAGAMMLPLANDKMIRKVPMTIASVMMAVMKVTVRLAMRYDGGYGGYDGEAR